MVQHLNFAYSKVFLLWKLALRVLASAYNMENISSGEICIEPFFGGGGGGGGGGFPRLLPCIVKG